MSTPLFQQPTSLPTVEIVREERHAGRLHRAVVLVDGQAVAYRSGRGRHWSCQACGLPGDGDCLHIQFVRTLLRRSR